MTFGDLAFSTQAGEKRHGSRPNLRHALRRCSARAIWAQARIFVRFFDLRGDSFDSTWDLAETTACIIRLYDDFYWMTHFGDPTFRLSR